MILSVSRRTDIPAFYTEWFLDKLGKEIIVINPFNKNQANSIPVRKDTIDCIVFWTKNPRPLMDRIGELDGYNYYFQFTVNGYGKRIEPGVPPIDEVIDTFTELSERIGKEKVIWRYDPIFISDDHGIDWHIDNFRYISGKLRGHTEKCVISFIDMYEKTKRNTSSLKIREPTSEEMDVLARELSSMAREAGIELCSCCEAIDLKRYGISHNKCIDDDLIRRLFGISVENKRDAQRDNCGCVKCTDVGVYNTCLHRCAYCYANFNHEMVDRNSRMNKVDSPIMIGELDDSVKVYPVKIVKATKSFF